MASGKRLEERHRAYELASLVWALTSERTTAFDLAEFFRCGSFADPASKRLPYNPLIEKFAHEMELEGRFLMPEELLKRVNVSS